MIVIDENSSFNSNYETFIALGNFDGLHLGHMSLVHKAINLAKEHEVKSMVYTFRNHPLTVINKDISPKLLMDNETKVEILKQSGVDLISMVQFDRKLMEMCPESFMHYLKTTYNMRGVVVGFNYRFGYKNSGDVDFLKILGKKYNYQVYVMDALKYEDEVISSSSIRRYLQQGEVAHANKLLSRPFGIRGLVISGRKIGRTLGFPTANMQIDDNLIYPKIGVYYTNVNIDNQIFRGITNIGYNPTVNGTSLSLETCILDFDSDIYGKTITVYFIDRIRDELKFNSKEELIKQMEKDKAYALDKKIELNIKK
jgi:riboflavin kinase / FMN adenylyltransferase